MRTWTSSLYIKELKRRILTESFAYALMYTLLIVFMFREYINPAYFNINVDSISIVGFMYLFIVILLRKTLKSAIEVYKKEYITVEFNSIEFWLSFIFTLFFVCVFKALIIYFLPQLLYLYSAIFIVLWPMAEKSVIMCMEGSSGPSVPITAENITSAPITTENVIAGLASDPEYTGYLRAIRSETTLLDGSIYKIVHVKSINDSLELTKFFRQPQGYGYDRLQEYFFERSIIDN